MAAATTELVSRHTHHPLPDDDGPYCKYDDKVGSDSSVRYPGDFG